MANAMIEQHGTVVMIDGHRGDRAVVDITNPIGGGWRRVEFEGGDVRSMTLTQIACTMSAAPPVWDWIWGMD